MSVAEVVPAAAPQGEGGTEAAPASHEETYPPQDLLTPCHHTERAIGAASFKLLRCPDCGMERIDRKVHYSSGYSPHLTCGCRAKREETHILVHATTSHSGVKRHVEHCAHCKSRQEWTSIIPQVVETVKCLSGPCALALVPGSRQAALVRVDKLEELLCPLADLMY